MEITGHIAQSSLIVYTFSVFTVLKLFGLQAIEMSCSKQLKKKRGFTEKELGDNIRNPRK